MSVNERWPLQKAVYQRLTAALQGAGVSGEDVPVFDHVPQGISDRLHVRIDGFSVSPGAANNGRRARHNFLVHVFDDNKGGQRGAGQEEIARLQAIVVNALDDWPPLNGATGIKHISSNSAPDEDELTQHGVSRFSTHIGV